MSRKVNKKTIKKLKVDKPITESVNSAFNQVGGYFGNLRSLTTDKKDSVVDAINEINAKSVNITGTAPIDVKDGVVSLAGASFNESNKSIQQDLDSDISSIKFRDNVNGTPNTILKFIPISGTSNGAQLLNPPIDVSDIINKNYSDQYLFGTIVKAGSTPTDNQIIAYNNSTKQWDFIDQNVNSVSTVQYEYKNDNTKGEWSKGTDGGTIIRNETLPDNCLGVYLSYFDETDSNNIININGLCSNIKDITTNQPTSNYSAAGGGFFYIKNDNQTIKLFDSKNIFIVVDISKIEDLYILVPSGTPAPEVKNDIIVKRDATSTTERGTIDSTGQITLDLQPPGSGGSTVQYEYIDDKPNWSKDPSYGIVRNEALPDNCLGVYLVYGDNSDANNNIEIGGFCSYLKDIQTYQPTNNLSSTEGGSFNLNENNDNKSINLLDVKGEVVTVDITNLAYIYRLVPSGTPAPTLKNTGTITRTATPSTESINIVNEELVVDLAPISSGGSTTVKAGSDITVKKTNDEYEVSVAEAFKLEVEANTLGLTTLGTEVTANKNSSFASFGQPINLPTKDNQLFTFNKDGTSKEIDVPSGGGGDPTDWSKFPALQNVDMAQKQMRNVTTVGNISGGLWSGINFVQKSDTQVARIDILDGVSSQSEGKEIKQFIKDNSTPAYVAPAFGGVITNKFIQSGSAYALVDNNFYNVFENASIPNDPGTTSIYNSIVNYVNFENIFGFNTDADDSTGGSKLSNNNKIYLQFSYKTQNSPIEKQVKLESNTISFAGGSVTGTQAVFKWDGAVALLVFPCGTLHWNILICAVVEFCFTHNTK